MNIQFLASTKGGRELHKTYRDIVSLLEKYGTVHGKHLTETSLTVHGETSLSSTAILDREIATLAHADLIVAEVTTPSLGVGYLIAIAVEKKKQVLCFYQGEHTDKLSAIIRGNDAIQLHLYKTREDIQHILETEI